MKGIKTLGFLMAFIISMTACTIKPEVSLDSKYSSAITFLYYEDFSYGTDFMEHVLQLELVMNQEFARVYAVNEKAFLGIVKKRDTTEVSGNTLFSLTSNNVESELDRVSKLEVYNLTDMKYFESIPLRSFFFDDREGHQFEIQQFLDKSGSARF